FFRIAEIPAIGLPQSGFEGSRLESENALGFDYYFGDWRHVEIDAKVSGLTHGIAAGFGDSLAGDPYDVRRLFPRGCRHGLHEFELGDRFLIGDVERFARRGRLLHGANAGAHQVLDVDELHQPVTVAGQNDRTIVAQPVPEEGLAIEWI